MMASTYNATRHNFYITCPSGSSVYYKNSVNLIPQAVVNSISLCTGILLNLTFITTMIAKFPNRTVTEVLLLALSCTDLATSILVTPITVARVILLTKERVVCVLGIINVVTGYPLVATSHLLIVIITIERYIYMVHPYLYDIYVTKAKTYTAILTATFISTLVTISSYIAGQERLLRDLTAIISTATHALFAYIQIKLFMFIQKKRRTVSFPDENEVGGDRGRTDHNGLITILYISLAFFICYTPPLIYCIFLQMTNATRENPVATRDMRKWLETLILLNCTLSPLVYYWRLSEIRKAEINIIRTLDIVQQFDLKSDK